MCDMSTVHDLTFHHIGLATSDFETPLRFYFGLGYRCVAEEVDERQDVELRLLEALGGGPRVELIKPLSESSPISRSLRTVGPCIYHCCYETRSLDDLLNELRKQHRLIRISEPTPAPLFGGASVSFWQIAGLGLYEFLERAA